MCPEGLDGIMAYRVLVGSSRTVNHGRHKVRQHLIHLVSHHGQYSYPLLFLSFGLGQVINLHAGRLLVGREGHKILDGIFRNPCTWLFVEFLVCSLGSLVCVDILCPKTTMVSSSSLVVIIFINLCGIVFYPSDLDNKEEVTEKYGIWKSALRAQRKNRMERSRRGSKGSHSRTLV
jgi:hypothetical protein